MSKPSKDLFEIDRRMELRMRLAAKQAGEKGHGPTEPIDTKPLKREVVDRVIDRVREL